MIAAMGHINIASLVLTLLSLCNGKEIHAATKNATEEFIRRYGSLGTLSREEFISLGNALQRGPRKFSGTARNDSCQCQTFSQIFQEVSSGGTQINDSSLSAACPLLLLKLHNEDCCSDSQSAVLEHAGKPPIGQAWGYGIGFVSLVVLISNTGVFLGPCIHTNAFKRILMFCVALAVGTLGSTGFLVLIPESMHLTGEDSPVPDYHWKMATVIGGAYFVFISERVLKFVIDRRRRPNSEDIIDDPADDKNQENGKVELLERKLHSHSHINLGVIDKDGKKEIAPVAWILLIGDAIHNFVDGLSIGAAFTEDTLLGISVSLAVLCEELPHELGDIAILLHAGLKMKRALFLNFIAAVISYAGLVIGILVGENTNANQWIFGFAGGLFVYIALSDMIPEMKEQLAEAESSGSENMYLVFLIQNSGLVLGFLIILCIVQFGGEIQV
ncbi:metal cation symporter ZIP14-like [Saccostrea echinata]|uniref:metal cation symporter ZIP14-like n=1 Tax=Saccostrea echinata TaxID=191078 RepID=UPI002A833DAA|nr:metal cation symporter ZIP14-like [Saccostrea echinata]